MEHIRHRSKQLVLAGISNNTRLAYNTAIQSFNTFRNLYALPQVWPCPESHVVMFMTYCFEKAYSPTSIASYISGLSCFHKINGWYSIADVFVVRKLLQGCRRLRSVVDNRAPITVLMLRHICTIMPAITYNSYEAVLFKALFTVAFFRLV